MIYKPLTYLIHLSPSNGVFPGLWYLKLQTLFLYLKMKTNKIITIITTNITNFCFIMETSVSLKLSSKLTLNTKRDPHSCSCYDDSESCELKNHITDVNIFLKIYRLWTLITFHYRDTITIFEWLVTIKAFNVWQETSQIEWLFETNLRPSGYFNWVVL